MKPVRLQSYRRSQFNSRKEGLRETVTDYARAMQQLIEKTYAEYEMSPSLRHTILLGQFEQCLLENWKKHLRHPIDSFEDGLQHARLAEAVEAQLLTQNADSSGGTAQSSNMVPQQSLQSSGESNATRPSPMPVTCFKFQKKGHYASECRSKKRPLSNALSATREAIMQRNALQRTQTWRQWKKSKNPHN